MTKNKKFAIPIAISILLLIVGMNYRIQHYPYAVEMEIIGFTFLALFYAFRFILKNGRTKKDTIKLILVILWTTGNLLARFKVDNIYYIQHSILFTALVLLILEVFTFKKNPSDRLNIVLYIGAVLLSFEIIFRILWLPRNSILHLVGLIFLGLGFLLNKHMRKHET